ncbi:hypothetical protein LO772_22645 [Yinghuangia sp. ASG 101]|uniref:hypothetical protein n=1 Tax=Yinghuangia sp. ASG 101 TaxID=2896848 RepID=UPI001E48C943|nr:hypothetical protein [Yinghuangia sp. ASG 101]UGQ09702.1 hypothetical protein LO772_22645 [Yinghuangia sp. ASG 101]
MTYRRISRHIRGATPGAAEREAAQAESTRDGAPPIERIDGERLCELLKQDDLGVRTVVRQVEDVTVDHTYFENR